MEARKADQRAAHRIGGQGRGLRYRWVELKPTPGSMDSMKSDMRGAAAVAGAFVLASAEASVHLIGLIPATDNRPG